MKSISDLKQDIWYYRHALQQAYYWQAMIRKFPRNKYYKALATKHEKYSKALLKGTLEIFGKKIGGEVL